MDNAKQIYNILTPTDKFFKFLLEKRQQSVVVSSSSPVSYKWGIEHGCSFLNFALHCQIVRLYLLVECNTLLL